MLIRFFFALRSAGVQVSLREHLTLIEGMSKGACPEGIEAFYHYARAALVKTESAIDRFDRVFSAFFGDGGAAGAAGEDGLDAHALPEEWLRRLAEKHLSEDEKKLVESLGGWEKLMETLKKRLEEQQGRHQGGNKWIGTAGTSPFGAYGYNPEGVRIGQEESRHRRAVKVWDKREFRDYDDDAELTGRAVRIALRRLRRWARDGAAEELDLDDTVRATASRGWLDVKLRPERRNAVKVLLFLDVGGSMDDHISVVEQLFAGARSEFKTLEPYYFHNCLYEHLWRNNRRRWEETTPTWEVINTYGQDYCAVFIGDAAMSPYEIAYPGGANEHWNAESGETWLKRAFGHWRRSIWLNPTPEQHWRYTASIGMIHKLVEGRMFPTTLSGLDDAMAALR
ncbi:MAG: VWA domain-containing protein [Neomegalonema sp.]|nr:VWA domain-containing protein [Neomegalonema sp.]